MVLLIRLISVIATGLARPSRKAAFVRLPRSQNERFLEVPVIVDERLGEWRSGILKQARKIMVSSDFINIAGEKSIYDLKFDIEDLAIIITLAINQKPNLNINKINLDTRLKHIDGMDSLDAFQFVEAIESYYEVALPDEMFESSNDELKTIKTVKDLAEALKNARDN